MRAIWIGVALTWPCPIATDTVSVFKFPTTGLAQKYEASTSNVYVIEDLVLVFAPTVSSELKQDYEKVVARLAA